MVKIKKIQMNMKTYSWMGRPKTVAPLLQSECPLVRVLKPLANVRALKDGALGTLLVTL